MRVSLVLLSLFVDAAVAEVREDRWSWVPVLRIRIADTCGMPHGASGAPAIRTDSEEVIGVFGTASDGTAAACALNNPCEVMPDGATTAAKERGDLHFVHAFYTCLDVGRSVDLDVLGCLLPKP